MTTPNNEADTPQVSLPLAVVAELQDHLMVAGNDLDRLQALLDDACDGLMTSFRGATEQLSAHQSAGLPSDALLALEEVRQTLGTAVTALQVQDMASQLIRHTQSRLRSCADRVAASAFAGDEDGDAVVEPAPLLPNPVTQGEMDVGSVELF